jgi:hypothetical protein
VRDAEVEQLGRRARGLVGHDHVLRLDVAVDHAAGVGMGERVGERHADAQHVAVAQLTLALEHRERPPAHELGHEEALVALDPGVEDGHDARVVEPGGRQRLALRAFGNRPGRRHGFDRHGPVEPFVPGREDRAEPTGAQPCPEPVPTQHEAAANGGRKLLRGVHPEALRRRRAGPCRRCRRTGCY